jgi:hypothetical protein
MLISLFTFELDVDSFVLDWVVAGVGRVLRLLVVKMTTAVEVLVLVTVL